MATIDLILLLLLVGFFILGRFKGFAWQIAGVGSIVLGGFAAHSFTPKISAWLGEERGLYHFLCWVLVYIGVSALVYLVAWRFRKFLEKQELEEIDKHLGGVLSVVKGSLFITLIGILAMTFSQGIRDRALNTVSGKVIAHIAHLFHAVLPVETHEALEPFFDDTQPAPPKPSPNPNTNTTPTNAITRPAPNAEPAKVFELSPWLKDMKQRSADRIKARMKGRPIPPRPTVPPRPKVEPRPPVPPKPTPEPDHEFPSSPYPSDLDKGYDPYRYDPVKPEKDPSTPR